jgi:hypothetical protein
MASIARALSRIKGDLSNLVSAELIEHICREAGHHWRQRLLDPVTTIHLFILQILYGNTACGHVPRIAGRSFSASAYCQARARLPLEFIRLLVARIGTALQQAAAGSGLWHGHRVILLDGSGFSMPDTPALQAHFGQPGGQKPGCGFPVAHLSVAIEAGSGMILDLIGSPLRTHDMAHVRKTHPKLRPGDVLVADRAFCSYAHLALILQGRMHACLRMHQRQIVDFRPHRAHVKGKHIKGLPTSHWVRTLGRLDQVVEWVKPKNTPRWMEQADFDTLPDSITVRELRYRVTQRGHRTRTVTLATTLLGPEKYPADELAELYGRRWQIETDLRHLKTTMRMDVLRCKTVDGVLKEMWMFALVYNLVRMVMLEAARRQRVEPDRISFIDALRWLAHAPPDEPLPALVVNPHRPGRLEPRAVKRRPKEYDRVNKPRAEMRKALLTKKPAA